MKRGIIVIALLFLWIFQCSFPFLLYKVQRWRCREQSFTALNSGFPEREIQTFSFQKGKGINWEIEGKEFKHNGNLYDVISVSEKEGNITIKCTSDDNEDHVIAHYYKTVKKKHRGGNQHQVKKIQYSKYIKHTNSDFYIEDAHHKFHFPESIAPLCFGSLEIIPPPPKC